MRELAPVKYNHIAKLADFYAVEFEVLETNDLCLRTRRKVIFCASISDFRDRINKYRWQGKVVPEAIQAHAIVTVSTFRKKEDQINLLNYFLNGEHDAANVAIYRIQDGAKKFFTRELQKSYWIPKKKKKKNDAEPVKAF